MFSRDELTMIARACACLAAEKRETAAAYDERGAEGGADFDAIAENLERIADKARGLRS